MLQSGRGPAEAARRTAPNSRGTAAARRHGTQAKQTRAGGHSQQEERPAATLLFAWKTQLTKPETATANQCMERRGEQVLWWQQRTLERVAEHESSSTVLSAFL